MTMQCDCGLLPHPERGIPFGQRLKLFLSFYQPSKDGDSPHPPFGRGLPDELFGDLP